MRAARERLRGKSTVIPSPDHTREVPGPRIAGIRVPTLVIHVQDDTLQPYQNAEFFFTTIPDSHILSFQRGGHIVSLIEVGEVGSAVQRHILDNAGKLCAQVFVPEATRVREEL